LRCAILYVESEPLAEEVLAKELAATALEQALEDGAAATVSGATTLEVGLSPGPASTAADLHHGVVHLSLPLDLMPRSGLEPLSPGALGFPGALSS
jgi:hypothetical protein